MEQALDYSILGTAGITQTEFAELCGVSRVTVNLWVNGKMYPHRYIRDSIVNNLAVIRSAVEGNRLPLPALDKPNKPARLQALRDALTTNNETA